MKKIESKEQFIEWTKQGNHALQYCDLQDEFAYSDIKQLKNWFMNMTQNEKELAVFSISKVMGSYTLFEFIKRYAIEKSEEYILEHSKELNAREDELFKNKVDIEKEQEQSRMTIAALEHQNKELIKDNDKMTETVATQYKRIYSLEDELQNLQKELEKMYQFESHIKSLLNN